MLPCITVADANNATVVGGAFQTVGASGGWLLGGGHGLVHCNIIRNIMFNVHNLVSQLPHWNQWGRSRLLVTGTLFDLIILRSFGANPAMFDSLRSSHRMAYIALRTLAKMRISSGLCAVADLVSALSLRAPLLLTQLMTSKYVFPSPFLLPPLTDMIFVHQIAIIEIQNITLDAQFEVFRVFAGLREQLAQEGWGGAFLPQVRTSRIHRETRCLTFSRSTPMVPWRSP